MSSRVASYFAAFAVILAHNMIFPVRGQPTVQDCEHKEQLTIELFGQLNKQVQSMQDLLQDMKNQLESVRRSLDQRLNEHDISIKNQTQNSWKLAVGLPVQLEVDLGDGPVLLPIVNNWIIIMNRFDGSLSFSRTWTEYKNGFGDIGRGEFWLGNEIVHRLTNTSGSVYTLRIEVYINGTWFYADYASFSLDSENDKYTLRLSGFRGNTSDSLTSTTMSSDGYLDGMSFTTWDADNDRHRNDNCAKSHSEGGGGWWFNFCQYACLTCSYNYGFRWYSMRHLSDGKLRAARMMIQSK